MAKHIFSLLPLHGLSDTQFGGSLAMQSKTMNRRLAMCLAVLLSACAGTRTESYFGDVTPQSGVCDPSHGASLTIRRDQVRFAPTQGVLVLSGSIAKDGMITATLTVLDMNRKPVQYRVAAHLAGDEVIGSYVTPRCTSSISLRHA